MEEIEKILEKNRFLVGNRFTESDIRLFVTLIRFDAVYYVHFKTNLKRTADYPNITGWLRDVYQLPGIAATVLFPQIKTVFFFHFILDRISTA